MKAKSLILIMIALGCGLVASIGVSQVMVKGGGEVQVKEAETTKILVAMEIIDIGNKLNSENLKLEEWPKDRVPEGAVSDIEKLKGKYSRARLVKGQVIVQELLVDEKDGLHIDIPDGYRVTSIKVSTDEVVSGLIQPGDRVDLTGYFRSGSGNIAKTFLHDVQIFSVNDKTERIIDPDGKAINARTISLLVTAKQVEEVMLAKRTGSITLSLRGQNDVADTNTGDGTSLEEILEGPSKRGSEAREAEKEEEDKEPSFDQWVNSQAGSMPLVPTPKPTVMMVHTSTGITRYTWTDPNGLPEVTEYTGGSIPPATPASGAPMNPVAPDAGKKEVTEEPSEKKEEVATPDDD